MTAAGERDARYVTHLERLLDSTADERRAMELAVGGEFDAFGELELALVRYAGLPADGFLIDVGCGSGRLALPLSRYLSGRYLGIDVVPGLLDFARKTVGRDDWRFDLAHDFRIDAPDGSADQVCFFSVFTHLLHEESFSYLREASRVVRPGGRVVFSFLEFAQQSHWEIFEATVAGMGTGAPHNQFLDRAGIDAWSRNVNLTVDEIHAGDEFFIPLDRPITWSNGARFETTGAFGQSVAILSRAAS